MTDKVAASELFRAICDLDRRTELETGEVKDLIFWFFLNENQHVGHSALWTMLVNLVEGHVLRDTIVAALLLCLEECERGNRHAVYNHYVQRISHLPKHRHLTNTDSTLLSYVLTQVFHVLIFDDKGSDTNLICFLRSVVPSYFINVPWFMTSEVVRQDPEALAYFSRYRYCTQYERCNSARFAVYSVLRQRCGFYKDVARLVARHIWATRNRDEWATKE